jgi:hypothetical protein
MGITFKIHSLGASAKRTIFGLPKKCDIGLQEKIVKICWTNLKRPVGVSFPWSIYNLLKVYITCRGYNSRKLQIG